MLNREIAINSFQLHLFSMTVPDIPDETMFTPADGHGHLPIWILGHLAFCAELGQHMLGGSLLHPEWQPVFDAGSSGEVDPSFPVDKQSLVSANEEGYAKLREMAVDPSNEALLKKDHGIELFAESPFEDVGDIVALLLTNHFGFHLAQLSSCRRQAGFTHLF